MSFHNYFPVFLPLSNIIFHRKCKLSEAYTEGKKKQAIKIKTNKNFTNKYSKLGFEKNKNKQLLNKTG